MGGNQADVGRNGTVIGAGALHLDPQAMGFFFLSLQTEINYLLILNDLVVRLA